VSWCTECGIQRFSEYRSSTGKCMLIFLNKTAERVCCGIVVTCKKRGARREGDNCKESSVVTIHVSVRDHCPTFRFFLGGQNPT